MAPVLSKLMKTLLLSFVLMTFISLMISAQEVDTGELFSVREGSVEFFNYEGPHDRIETDAQIRGIGSALAGDGRTTLFSGYRITHIPPSNQGEMGADVFEILAGARVDHIDNVRRIVSGYVTEKYGYDRSISDTIALFATYYNAVHRNNMEYLGTTYIPSVLSVLDREKAGISTNYRDWAGNTQMLIPVSLDGTGVHRIDADTVGSEEVIEEIRSLEEDRGTDERKGMVELREDQLEQEKAETAEERARLEEQKEQVQERREEIARQRQQEEQEEQEEQEDSPEQTREERSSQEEELEREQEQIDREEERIARAEEEQQEREEAISTERDRIARDEQESIARAEQEEDEAESDEAGRAVREPVADRARFQFMRVREDQSILLSTILLLNSRTGEVERRSQVNSIRGRRVYPVERGYIAVVGVDNPPQTVKMMLLDSDTLSVTGESREQLYGETWVLIHENSAYAVASLGGGWKLAAFRTDTLEMTASSSMTVNPHGVLSIAAGALIAEGSDGSLLRLNPETLLPVSE
jgi:flagellar biosynthesis GTPase FlhF